MIPYLIVLALAIGFGSAWKVQAWRMGAQDVERMTQAREDHKRLERLGDQAAAGHESDKAAIETRFVVITEKVDHVLQSDFYAAGAPACLDDDGVRELNGAIRARDAASQPAPALPRPDRTHWWQSSSSSQVEH